MMRVFRLLCRDDGGCAELRLLNRRFGVRESRSTVRQLCMLSSVSQALRFIWFVRLVGFVRTPKAV